MASVYKKQKRGKWYLRVKDSTGRWTARASNARTKAEARRLADDLERKAERVLLGLEARPALDGGTLGELFSWWLEGHSRRLNSHTRDESTFRRHLLSSDLARHPLVAITPARIETYLSSKAGEGLAPATVNQLRAHLSRVFNAARKVGRYSGPNPVAEVKKRRVPRRLPDYLRVHEVKAVMGALDEWWRPLFAAAIFTGLRKGELLGLRKTDVDFEAGLITVARSYDRNTTKGGHADAIPIATELEPFLRAAIAASSSNLVFPKPDGSMMNKQVALESVLRRAMGRAGIVLGYRHTCRHKGCHHVEAAPDKSPRRCPRCHMVLWPKPEVRPIRFHDLRHTTASLLMMAGANPAAVQRILRHSDPRITTEVYGHLAPGYLRAEVDRLAFGLPAPELPVEVPAAPAGAAASPLVTRLLPDGSPANSKAGTPGMNPEESRPDALARPRGFEPLAFGFVVRRSIQLS